MNREEEFERKFLHARLLGQGISFLMTKLLIEHVRTQGKDLEASMVATRGMLEWSLLSFQGSVQTENGVELEISDATRGKLRLILDVIEREARETLNLAPPVKDRH